MKKFAIKSIADVHTLTIDKQPVIFLDDSEAKELSMMNPAQQRTYLLRTLDPERLERLKKAFDQPKSTLC